MAGDDLEFLPWYAESRTRATDVSVQNEKYFLKAMAAAVRRIPDADVQFFCAALERHVTEQAES